jgi:antibiotic biosynthesis monooxygenase (ABM) superfamily enzyme
MDPTPKRQLPPWLIGLLIALVVFAVVFIVANLLGFGDDPVIGAFGVATAPTLG